MDLTSFSGLFGDVSHGELNDTATAELKVLVAEMLRVQRIEGGTPKGKMTIALDFKLEKGCFEIRSSTTVKLPAKARPRAFLFATKDGGLSEEDQRQHSFDLAVPKDVSTGAATNVRDIRDRGMAAANDRA